ncbi:MAG: tyrosine--tRNA ligase [Defluviitaleaceae bacterium]|nr:tyrosine--tRNA ligase [Defluviitaleaceae bacterium]
MNLYETLTNRRYISQVTHEIEVKELLNNQKSHFYIGFDPTADSLHVGHFLTLIASSILQKHGHTPIILVGGGTSMIGDPSGRSDMRKMLTKEDIQNNVSKIKKQFSRFITFENDKAILVDNAEWLTNLNYIEFLRNYGAMFSVNRMLTADSYKTRLEQGLTFLEFNYMIMQAYDFLELNKRYKCTLQIGGRDQWSNILAGVDLVRRVENKEVYGLTLSLLETKSGQKMGKTAKGALWLDIEKTSAFEFYQYFRNVDDSDVLNFLKLLTFIDDEEIKEVENLKGSEINKAKILLAYNVTKLVHGEDEANKARNTAENIFINNNFESDMPKFNIIENEVLDGIDILTLLVNSGLSKSKTEARRLVEQKGIKINDNVIEETDKKIKDIEIKNNQFIIQKGKKNYLKVMIDS